MRPGVWLLLVAALLAAVAATARAATALQFTTVTRGGKASTFEGDLGRTYAFVSTTALEGYAFINAMTTADKAAMDAVDFDKRFVIGVMTERRTSGWQVTIQRVALQRVARGKRQFCVVARIDPPRAGEAVIAKPWYSAHTVSLAAQRFRVDAFHWNIPTAVVVRSPNGALLAVSHAGSDNRNRPIPTGVAKACRR